MWSIFLVGIGAGIAATPHCLGMCGGFPLHLAKSCHESSSYLRHLLFLTGKVFTYVFLGALAGAMGLVLFKNTALSSLSPALQVFAGILTLFFGLLMLGIEIRPIKAIENIADAAYFRNIFGRLLLNPGPAASFVLGLGVGFIPCPLPLAMLSIAATTHSVLHGMVLMAGVGVGTAPGLLAVGLFGSGLKSKFAGLGMKAAGIAVIFIALITIGRATGIIHKASPINSAIPSCCQVHSQ